MSSLDSVVWGLDEAHRGLLEWVARFEPAASAPATAAAALARWAGDAMRGERTPYGPYRLLYKHAEYLMTHFAIVDARDLPFGIWRTIPVPTREQLALLAWVYACIYQMHELAAVSWAERNLLQGVLYQCRYDGEGHWLRPARHPDLAAATAIVERAHVAIDAPHECPSGHCGEFTYLWHREEKASWRWLQDFKNHARENLHGF